MIIKFSKKKFFFFVQPIKTYKENILFIFISEYSINILSYLIFNYLFYFILFNLYFSYSIFWYLLYFILFVFVF